LLVCHFVAINVASGCHWTNRWRCGLPVFLSVLQCQPNAVDVAVSVSASCLSIMSQLHTIHI